MVPSERLWEAEFERWLKPFLDELCHTSQRKWAPVYVRGLIAPGERKSIEPIARRICPRDTQQLHHFVSTSPWNADPLEAVLVEKAGELVGGPRSHLIIDDTALVKKGAHSVGVGHQYCGQLGKRANCQTLVSLTLAREKVPIPIGLRLYLPQDWAGDPRRRKRCGVPGDLAFRPKWRIALEEVERVLRNGTSFGDVLADAGYGCCSDFRQGLSALGLLWIVGVMHDQRVYPLNAKVRVGRNKDGIGQPRKRASVSLPYLKVSEVVHSMKLAEFQRFDESGQTVHFAAIRIRVADGPRTYERTLGPGETAWLIAEKRARGEIKYYLSNYPANADVTTLFRGVKARWACEQAHQQLKEELGLDHFEGRSWTGLHHHALMSMIAFAFLQHLRLQENKRAA